MTILSAILLSIDLILVFAVISLLFGKHLKSVQSFREQEEERAEIEMRRKFDKSLNEDLNNAKDAREMCKIFITHYEQMRGWLAWKYGETDDRTIYFSRSIEDMNKLLEDLNNIK